MTWQLRRVGDLATLLNGFPFDANDFLEVGEVPLIRIRDLLNRTPTTFVNASIVPPSAYLCDGDVVIGMDGDFNVILWDRGPAALNQRLCILRSHPETDPRFLAYVLPDHLRVINDLTYATTVKHLSSGQVRAIRFQCPPLEMQRTIADFLDAETHKIDQLISEQNRMIDLLSERRKAIVESLLGTKVGHGERLKWIIEERDLRAGARVGELPLMSVSIAWGVRRREEAFDTESRAEDLTLYKICEPGDVVINRMRAFQGALGLAPEAGIVSPDYAVLRVTDRVDPEWLVQVMRSPIFVSEMALRVKGIGSADLGAARTPRISVSDLGEIRVAIPPLATQREQSDSVKHQVAGVEALVREAERLIALSQERRTALIAAAVRGDIEIRKGAA